MQRARWFVVVGSLAASVAFLPLADHFSPPSAVAHAQQADLQNAKQSEFRLELVGEGLNAETLKKFSAAEKLKYQLRRNVKFTMNQDKLEDLANQISKQCGINVVIDKKALEEAAFDTATPIDKEFTEPVELRTAMRFVLRDLGLSYVIEKDTLLLTTKTAQENMQMIKMYPVGEFVRPVGSAPTEAPDFDSLIQLIQSSIQPTTWRANGGQGDIPHLPILDVLVISNTQEVHDDLEELFAELRKIHAAKAETVATNETGMKRVVYPIVLPRARQTKVTRDKDNKESVEVTNEGEPRFTMEELSALVKKSIEPATWNDDKVGIAVLGEKLVITQTQATHRKVSELLHELEVFPWQQSTGPNGNRNNPPRGQGGLGGSAAGCGPNDSGRSGGLF